MRQDTCLKIHFNLKKILFFFAILLLGLLFCAPQNLSCQNPGFKYIKNYSRKDHDRIRYTNSILQDKRGIIYFRSLGGLLEFDGGFWRVIKTPSIISMAIDDTGTIYVGGYKEIGFLTPDPNGSLQYKSLLDHLDNNKRNFGYSNSTHSTREGIYFETDKFLFRWDCKQIKAWNWSNRAHQCFTCKGKLYIYERDVGLMHMVKDSMKLVPGGETLAGKSFCTIIPYNSQKRLIGTSNNGFYIYDGIKAESFPTEVDDYLKGKQINHGIRLFSSPGDVALATSRGGLVIIDANGKLKDIFSIDCGLQDDNVANVFEDFQGNLWLGLGKGISKIEYNSPISIYDNRSNLPISVFSVIRHHNDLYVGTDRGLYSLASPGLFRPVPGISNRCWKILSIGDSLLVATMSGVVQVGNDNSVIPIVIRDSRNEMSLPPFLWQSKKDPNRVWVARRRGLVSLYFDNKTGQWEKEREFYFDLFLLYVSPFAEDKKGNLWVTVRSGILKIEFPVAGRINNPVVTRYDTSNGLPSQVVLPYMAADHIIFVSTKGIYRFDEKNKVFIPDLTLGDEFAGGEKRRYISCIVEDKKKNIWFSFKSRVHQAIRQPNGSFVIHSKPFLRLTPTMMYDIYHEDDGDAVWFASKEGLIRYDTRIERKYDLDFPTLIRKVVANGNLIFGGYKTGRDNNSNTKVFFTRIPYKDGNLHFEFAAPFFEDESATQYRYFLEGYDDDWSDWNLETCKEYPNLHPGTYMFRVEAKKIYGDLGREAVYQFKILTPWYRTWWAFLSYAVVLFMLTYLIVKWRRSLQLEKEKQTLEQTIKDRTKELEEQAEKLKEMDKVKSHFFANISHEFRTPITLIMGPLEQMLSKSRDKEQQKSLNLMLRNSRRLLSLINQLLELSKFDSGKIKLHSSQQNIIPFLKGIVSTFEPVVNKNELYLTFHTEEENITLYFDSKKLEEAVFNLFSNAIKFTPPGGKITIKIIRTLTEDENFPYGSVNISVCDTGPGIPRDQLAHIFDRFYQSESTYENNHKGSGIGLAIAKEVIELHHGKINVHSLEGKGTEFIIRLPLPGVPVDAKGVPADAKGVLADDKGVPADAKAVVLEDLNLAEDDCDENDAAEAEKDIDPFEQTKDIILVVEDSADVREYIRSSLESHYTVVEANNGGEGIQKAQEIIPDLIISDIMMPEKDGYELCRVLKSDKFTSHVPIILLTAKASEESILHGLETGADDYVTKPFNTNILCARIKNLIDLRRQMQANLNREMTLQPVKTAVSKLDREFIRELQEVIEKNLSEPEFNVEELKNKLYISRTSLYRKIQALSGRSPTDFIRSYRLKRAAQLLKSGFGSVTEVAFEVGFTSRAYFAKCFKEKFHQSPSTFKESQG